MLVLGWLPVRGLGCTLLRHAALPAPPCPLLSSTDSNVSRALHPALVVINDGTTRAPGPHCCSIFNLHGTVSLCCFQSQHACGPGPASVTQASKQASAALLFVLPYWSTPPSAALGRPQRPSGGTHGQHPPGKRTSEQRRLRGEPGNSRTRCWTSARQLAAPQGSARRGAAAEAAMAAPRALGRPVVNSTDWLTSG